MITVIAKILNNQNKLIKFRIGKKIKIIKSIKNNLITEERKLPLHNVLFLDVHKDFPFV